MLISRREALKRTACTAALPCIMKNSRNSDAARQDDSKFIIEARYYEKLPEKKIICNLCPRKCEIDDLERGYCGVRENRSGIYYSLVYSRPCSVHIDPIEKKPLYHFLPGTTAFSIATAGCNVECKFCQNWEISQKRPEELPSYHMTPDQIAGMASSRKVPTIAYTYSEPVIFYEYMYDCAVEGRKKNIKSVMISNGFIQEKPMKKLSEVLDGVKIDLKAFTEKFYRELVTGELKPVLNTLVLLSKLEMWTEIVYLMIPGLNDKKSELQNMCKWIKNELGPDIPVHFSRFHPSFRLKNVPPTPVKTLENAKEIADEEGLHFAYIGNIPGHPAENTVCPECGEIILDRKGYRVVINNVNKGKHICGYKIPGIWE